ncbi:MAG TPA: lipoyl(octanoyl) transferase LipB [Polyangiaceae bacterium]
MTRRTVRGIWLGRRRYEPVHALQLDLFEARREGGMGDTILFVEHDPVVTVGKGAKPEHLLAPRERLRAQGVDVVDVGRGGDVTLHAPGQLVAYPVVDLSPDRRDVRRYVNLLSECMQRLVAAWGVAAGPMPRYVGLWADRSSPARWLGGDLALEPVKLGAIGVRISRWVTMHGFALNLTTDLDLYKFIVPCGIREHAVASVASLTCAEPSVPATARRAFDVLAELMGAEQIGYDDWSAAPLDEVLVATRSTLASSPAAPVSTVRAENPSSSRRDWSSATETK